MKLDCEKRNNRKKEENGNKKTIKGITLIALVITIIVLLILAGVSIAMLTEQNGILTQSNIARANTEKAEAIERAQLDIANWQAGELKEGREGKVTNAKIKEILTGKDYVEGTPGDTSFVSEKGSHEIKYSEIYKVIEGGEETGETVGKDFTDSKGNEWIWIEVPKSVTASANTDSEIETVLQTYATAYRESGYTDTWYDGCGLTEEEYNNLKSKMLQSIKENGGFNIGKYEMGTDTQRKAKTDTLTTSLIQQDKYVYNYVTCSQAQNLASQLSTDTKTSSLMFGIQWDLVLKYIEERGVKTQSELKANSTSWGNYYNSTFNITRGKYSIDAGNNYTNVAETYTKASSTNVLLTTGTSERNSALNIYDLAGNISEWTLEKSSNTSRPCTGRGGNYHYDGGDNPASDRYLYSTSHTSSYVAYRPALY